MKIHSIDQDVYSVELTNNGKSLSDYIYQLREKNEKQSKTTEVCLYICIKNIYLSVFSY